MCVYMHVHKHEPEFTLNLKVCKPQLHHWHSTGRLLLSVTVQVVLQCGMLLSVPGLL